MKKITFFLWGFIIACLLLSIYFIGLYEKNKMTEEDYILLGMNLYNEARELYLGKNDNVGIFIEENFTTEFKDYLLQTSVIYYENGVLKINKKIEPDNLTYIDTKLKINILKKDNIIYSALSSYKNNTNEELKTIESKFVIEKIDKQWKISGFNFPILEG